MLIENFEFEGNKFEDLPIRYIKFDDAIEIFFIWYDNFDLRNAINKFIEKAEKDNYFNLLPIDCLPISILNRSRLKKVKELCYDYIRFDVKNLKFVPFLHNKTDSSQLEEQLDKLCNNLNTILEGEKLVLTSEEANPQNFDDIKSIISNFPEKVNFFLLSKSMGEQLQLNEKELNDASVFYVDR
jgi:hypothetical protein